MNLLIMQGGLVLITSGLFDPRICAESALLFSMHVSVSESHVRVKLLHNNQRLSMTSYMIACAVSTHAIQLATLACKYVA